MTNLMQSNYTNINLNEECLLGYLNNPESLETSTSTLCDFLESKGAFFESNLDDFSVL